ncbi:unnamed protein product [Owenia fusiformis]|uniref:Solute carrier organic anion transporter family member n=1 Tax=Owenia fusiformis TaxID=6347 RepID=A0A8J1UEU7_OWEFU|nr:unnamed protein product [Owenia fusiformis]
MAPSKKPIVRNGAYEEQHHAMLQKKDIEYEVIDPALTRCGIGPLTCAALQKFATIKVFCAVLCLVTVVSMIQGVYLIGVIRQLEKRFGLRGSETGLILSMDDFVHIGLILFIGHIGDRVNKPKVIASAVIFTALGGFLMSLPHFLYEGELNEQMHKLNPNLINKTQQENASFSMNSDQTGLCHLGVFNQSEQDRQCLSGEKRSGFSKNPGAYGIFLAAKVLMGIGGSPVSTYGMTYIDENVPKVSDSSFYLGLVRMTYAWGPILGLLLSGVMVKIPNDLKESHLTPEDTDFIGAWWLAYVFLPFILLILAVPLAFFPKHLPHARKIIKDTETKDHWRKTHTGHTVKDNLKDFFLSFGELLRKPAYVCLVINSTLGVYIIYTLFVNMPRYIEAQFQQPVFISNIISGSSSAVAGSVGIFLGGFILRRRKLKPPGAAKILAITLFLSTVGLGVAMIFNCPQDHLAGYTPGEPKWEPSLPCNGNCSCDLELYKPVCGSDKRSYYSQCYAGCSQQTGKRSFADCACTKSLDNSTVSSYNSTSSALKGLCRPSCMAVIPFAIVLAVVAFINSIGAVPSTILMFRIVGDSRKAFALGVNSFVYNLLGFIPGPIVAGIIVDTTCIVWQRSCGKTGGCLLYSADLQRQRMVGATVGVKIVILVFSLIVYALVRRQHWDDEPDSEDQKVKIEMKDHHSNDTSTKKLMTKNHTDA